MKGELLKNKVKLVAMHSNQKSVLPLHRAIQIESYQLSAYSEFGTICIGCAIAGIDRPLLVDAAAFDTVIASLNDADEITFKTDGDVLRWTINNRAKGHWQTIASDKKVPEISFDPEAEFWVPPPDFAKALYLAGAACIDATVSVGLYGVSLRIDGELLRMASSNNVALATTSVDADRAVSAMIGDRVLCLRPPVPTIIRHVLATDKDNHNLRFRFNENSIIMLDQANNNLYAEYPLATPLEQDLFAMVDQYKSMEHASYVEPADLAKFLNRAKQLADRKQAIRVSFAVQEGQLLLKQSGLSASSQEFFMAKDLGEGENYKSVQLSLDLLLVPLENIEIVICDYLSDSVLVLMSESCNYTYILSAAADAAI